MAKLNVDADNSREEYEDFEFDGVDDSGDEVNDDEETLEDEDSEDEIDEDDETDDVIDDETEGDSDEDEDDPEDETPKDTKDKRVKFTNEQQKVVDQIVQKRLERKDTQFVRQISEEAGVSLAHEEITQSAKLWGLLKANPELSEAVDLVIKTQLSQGKAKEVVKNVSSKREAILEVKEATLDLKLSDPLFRKNADKILEWADDQGYEVNSKKSLQLAVLAWKGSNDSILTKARQSSEQKRKSAKKATQKRAGAQGGSSAKTKTPQDFRKLSDKDVLTRSGLSLFTDE